MTETLTTPTYWTTTQKIAFRFSMLVLVMFILFNPNGLLLVNSVFDLVYGDFLRKAIVWLGNSVLHLTKPVTIFTNGSGDTTYDYLVLLFIAMLASAGTIIWTTIDRKQRNYNKMFYWLSVVVRFYLSITMISYGYVKIIKLQFPSPSPDRLLEPFGNASPMGLAWTYMGFSTGFNLFTGIAEVTCALLLFFRRTTTMGALVGLVVAGNIMAINYCFDVPVKIMSTAMVVMCIFLLVKDAPRLINFFILNKPTPAANLAPPRFKQKWKNITAITLKYILMAYVLIGYFISNISASTQYGDKAAKPLFYGIYNVKSVVSGTDTIPPLKTDSTRWDKLVIGAFRASVHMMNDSIKYYQVKADTTARTFVFTQGAKTNVLKYVKIGPDLKLTGDWDNRPVQIDLAYYNMKNFLLINRGFHWVNEFPLNR